MEFSPSLCQPGLVETSFRWLVSAAGLSNLADGVLKVALPLAAVGMTRSPLAIAGLTFAFTLPWLLFALPAGALVDRVDRRRAMLVANGVRVALVGALIGPMLLGGGSIVLLYVVAFGVGIAETVYDTAAQSIVPQIVGRERLSQANGRLYAAELTANEFLGPPVAGLLITAGVAVAFTAPAGLWIIALGALLLVRGRFRVARERPTSIRADIAEGLRFVLHHRLLRTFAIMVGVFNLAGNAMQAVLVLHAVGPGSALRLSPQGFGLLLATFAVGSLLGSLVAHRIERMLGRARTLLVAIVLGALAIGAPAVAPGPIALGAVFVLGGAGIVVTNVVLVSLRQRITPDRLLGRVNSAYRLVAWGTMPVGAAVGGLLGQAVGLPVVFAAMGVLALATTAGLFVATDTAMDSAEGLDLR